ncbi:MULTISPECIES: DegQ family serine endoprotease [Mesorhizobium]|uniref:DegQ family serine endoprotease n=1 Tax=Mesorhizobium denitrificans TaxID=2294114 RepID=A0A371X6S6_9HYPH|nr:MULTISPECIES: DegQ family serine endoprotease [Mesorhizobium]RFC64913.1 DegQ family serine endoprotease [Mesorhizobium denitrificans]
MRGIRLISLSLVVLLTAAIGSVQAQSKNGQGVLDKLFGSETAGPKADKRTPFGRGEMELSFAPLVKQTAPAVVNVYASKQVEPQQSPFMGDPFFERFFGRQEAPPRARSSLGSGVLVDPRGYVITNYHVIRDADEIKVATPDGREFESKVLLKVEEVDLAVLKIDAPTPFPSLNLGDSDALEVGDLVLAIGNPFGVGQTTTSGIISALARSHIGVSDFGFFIQTDAAINPGNSGGALINMSGQLVGINTAIFSRSGGSIGIGFAIPSNMVRAVMQAAMSGAQTFARPYIGATFEPVTAQIAEALGMETPSGALVSKVEQGGPADKAGLKPGDVVLALNDALIEHVDALGYRLATQMIGASVKLTLLRQGAKQEVSATLEKEPEDAGDKTVAIAGDSPFAGVSVATLTPRLASKIRIPTEVKGVVVVDLDRNSPAASVGIRPGDIVREVNGTAIEAPTDLTQATSEKTRWWRFTIERGGRILRQTLRY